MWKALVVVAVTAYTFLITTTEANKRCRKPNEVFDICPAPCPPRECGVNIAATLCAPAPKIGDPKCRPSCRCADGFLRNKTGICIPEAQCPTECPENEIFDTCPAPCPPLKCGVNKALILCAPGPKPGDPKCAPSCRCADGFLRNKAGKCIPENECPIDCPVNEVYDICPAPCPPLRCGVNRAVIRCAAPPKPGDPNCNPSCRCADGFLRNKEGTCIPEAQCPRKCPKNEVFDVCPAPCPPLECGVNKALIRCAAPPKPGDPNCKPSCRCADGFLRNKAGFCVPEAECPSPCGTNEELSPCSNGGCGPWTCSDLGFPTGCVKMDPKYCILYICKEGFVKNDNGTCIPSTECPECGGDSNAIAGCGTNCGRLCSNYNKGPVSCTEECLRNACDCREGFVLDESSNKCVRPFECKCNQPNEYYDPCPPKCPKQVCESIGKTHKCPITTAACKGECRCDKGYFRNKIGQCIKGDDCLKCTGPNEYFSCGGACDNVCATINKQNQTSCPIVNIQCNSMCYCEEGYARDANNICIPIEKCPAPQCKDDERYEECPAWLSNPQTCSEVGLFECPKMPRDASETCPGPPACVCDYDLVRNDEGKCVPPNQCPPVCKNNEVYDFCANAGCEKRNCSQLGLPDFCTDVTQCIGGCVCVKGFVFDENLKKCVPPNKCTPQCKPGERYEQCPDWLCTPQTCSQVGFPCPGISGDTRVSCPGPPACVCDNNYVRNDQGDCIPSNQCPPVCKNNEVYDFCANAGCEKRNCSQLGLPDFCTDVTQCIGGCVCVKGFLRSENGNCIPEKQCPIPTCPNPKRERFEWCPGGQCLPQSCSEVGFPLQCPELSDSSNCQGPPRCVCKDGYVRNSNGKCIPIKKCPSCGGDPNAVSGCGTNSCNRLCSNYDKPPVPCPRICRVNACDCKPGFVFDENLKKCVPPNKCTPQCKPGERYEQCPDWLCTPQTCSQVGFPCPGISGDTRVSCPGPPACVCDNNYVRNDQGDCIPSNQCPPVCKNNEVYDFCANAGCEKRNCSQLGLPDFCTDVTQCIGGCVCVKGFLRSENGNCIPEKQCPIPTCPNPKRERFEWCPGGQCLPQSCSEVGFPLQCPELSDSSNCQGPPRCVCKDGYVRNSNGKCIPIKKCPSCGGDPNAVSGCGTNSCNRLCSNYDKPPVPCPRICRVNACDCKPGFVFDENLKKCVPPNKCTPQCKPGERYEQCPDWLCTPQTCSQVGFPCPGISGDTRVSCPGPPACVCDNNYVRNDQGDCIPSNQCPPVCKNNEVYDFCANAGCEKRNCSQLGLPDFCTDVTQCIGGCVCVKGFLRSENGNCIPEKQCPIPTCPNPKRERFEWCPGGQCLPQSCSEVGFPLQCPELSDSSNCQGPPRCVCKDGYVRNSNGKCIPIKKCPSCGGDPNAVSGCGTNSCNRLCSNYDKPPVPCPRICRVNACDCKPGFVFDENLKKCVPPNKCTPQCKPGERYEQCPDWLCTPQTCSQVGFPIACPGISGDTRVSCPGPPACVCDNNYVRNDQGDCIPSNQCPSCGGDPNAVSGCGVNCGRLCSNYNRTDVACITVCYPNACDCKKGYVLDENINQCVRPKQCTPVCGLNEIYDTCSNSGCQKRNCSQLGQPDVCTLVKKCSGGCVCQEGFLRTKEGKCVPQKECPIPTCPTNERFVWCPDTLCTPQSCTDVGFPVPCPILAEDSGCPGPPRCVCNEGYARNSDGKCVPVKQCPSCGGDPNAVSGCGTNRCNRLCSNYDEPRVPCPKICMVNACDCKKGFVFDENINKCVLPKQCSPICGPDEVFTECIEGVCQAVNCSQLGKPVPCKFVPKNSCTKGCLCKKGYLRRDDGVCVPQEQCNQCNRPNEYYDPCPPRCPPQTCESIGKTYKCPITTAVCKGACRCNKGYFRNKIGECIKGHDCLKCRGPHEYFSCGGACDNVCLTLSQQNQTNCPIVNIQCNSMCYCEKGYARDENNICVPIEKCPVSCGGDPYAKPGCGVNCGKRCSDYNKKPAFCPLICKVNGCDCKDGFVYDDNLKKCVLPEDCTPVCKTNEVYDTCANGGCQNRNCSQFGQPTLCIDPIKCNGGCVCQTGYLRAQNGTCVPENQCPGICRRPNEFYDPCPPICPPQTCESLNKKYFCPANIVNGTKRCRSACRCKEGFFRNSVGQCILKSDCLKCTGPNEYFACGGACDNVCATLDKQNQTNCPIRNIKCNPMCYCNKGYARDYNKICVPIEQCPAATSTTTTSSPPAAVNTTEATERLNNGVIIAAGKFLYQLASKSPNDNIILSATSVIIALAQLSLFTTGLVLEQLLNFFNLRNKNEIRTMFPELIKSYQNQTHVDFSAVTKYYANEEYPLSAYFKEESKKIFNSTGENLDFTKAEEAAGIINKWVSDNTNGKIQDLVKAEMFDTDTRLVLVNAIYFLGNWVYQFNPNNTENKDFYKSNGDTVTVEMMYQKNNFDYTENDQYQTLKMRYKGNAFSCVVVLPRKKDALLETIKALQNPEELKNMLKNLRRQEVEVNIPKMLIKTEMNIAEMLQKENVTAMFNPNNKDFDGILEKKQDLYVSAAVQQAYLSFNEVGTEATAATAIVINTRSLKPLPPAVFNANHPYLFYIMFEDTVLFCGTFVN